MAAQDEGEVPRIWGRFKLSAGFKVRIPSTVSPGGSPALCRSKAYLRTTGLRLKQLRDSHRNRTFVPILVSTADRVPLTLDSRWTGVRPSWLETQNAYDQPSRAQSATARYVRDRSRFRPS